MVSREGYFSEKLYEGTCQNDIETVVYCLKNSADVNYIHKDFKTSSLHVACMESNFDIIHLFIENGVNLLIKDGHNQTPVDMLNETLAQYHQTYPKCK